MVEEVKCLVQWLQTWAATFCQQIVVTLHLIVDFTFVSGNIISTSPFSF